MRREEIEAIALGGGEPARELVVGLLEQVAQVPALRERIEELERRVGRDSGNSSQPPSSDAPKSRAERRRAAREAYKRSMRKSGGQPGHEGKTRQLAAPERVDEHRVHLPVRCGCGHVFTGAEQRIDDPVAHQQYELAVIRPLVFEHCRVRLGCPGCGRASLTGAGFPFFNIYRRVVISRADRLVSDVIASAGRGPSLAACAAMALLAPLFRLNADRSTRGLQIVAVADLPRSA